MNKGGKPYIQVKVKGESKDFSPEEISAMILTKMKDTAEAYLGKKLNHAVVTVPGIWNFELNVLNSKHWKKNTSFFFFITKCVKFIIWDGIYNFSQFKGSVFSLALGKSQPKLLINCPMQL